MDTIKENDEVKFLPDQRIKYFNHIGKIKFGKYVSESEPIKGIRHITIMNENDALEIISISKVWSYQDK